MGYEPIDAWYEEQQEAISNRLVEEYRDSDEYAEGLSRAIEDFVSERQKNTKIFISYRRDEAEEEADRLYNGLCRHFDHNQIFRDIDSIEPGEDFVEVIQHAVGCCNILIAIIGKTWLNITDNIGFRRLDNPEDFVRLEIATALERNILVIPVLIQGAKMPDSRELPETLVKLGRRHALEFTSDGWEHEVGGLIQTLKSAITKSI